MRFENILICGLGAVGSNSAINIAHDLPSVNIIGIDFDKVEERNYSAGTQAYTKNYLNKYKTQSMQLIIYSHTGKRIQTINKKIESKDDILNILNVVGENTIILDAFDKSTYRNILHNIVFNDTKIEILHAGFNPTLSSAVVWDELWTETNNTKPIDTDICGQPGARSFILSMTSLTTSIINDFYFNDVKTNIYFDSGLNLKIIK